MNRKLSPEDAIGPEKWERMTPENKASHIASRPARDYMGNNIFIYDKNDLFETYEITYKKQMKELINYYMIDFRYIYKVEYKIKGSPRGVIKHMQLTNGARSDLRSKLADYFGRTPEEDEI